MKVSYLFPIFKEDNAKVFFENFFKSDFFKKNKNYELFIYLSEKDEVNIKACESFAKKISGLKIIKLYEKFLYNDAFFDVLNKVNGDVLLLGDAKISKIDIVFSRLFEKKNEGAKIVFVNKKKQGFNGWWKGLWEKFYNFFVKLFSNKSDKCNVISLGLYDKDVLQLLKVLPSKNTFIKNSKDLKGFKTETLFIEENITVYKPHKNKVTLSTKILITSLVILFSFVISNIIANCLIKKELVVFNIITIFSVLSCIASTVIALPKIIYDKRNEPDYNFFITHFKEYGEEINLKNQKDKEKNVNTKVKNKTSLKQNKKIEKTTRKNQNTRNTKKKNVNTKIDKEDSYTKDKELLKESKKKNNNSETLPTREEKIDKETLIESRKKLYIDAEILPKKEIKKDNGIKKSIEKSSNTKTKKQ